MKQFFSKALLFSIIGLAAIAFISTGCEKDDDNPPASGNIQGLYVGTFTTVSGFAEPAGTNFYFSISVYPDGTLSYKSGTNTSNTFVYAAGTWTLTGNTFSWEATTLNRQPSQVDVTGTATYNSQNGTFTNGVVTTASPATQASWKMDKVN